MAGEDFTLRSADRLARCGEDAGAPVAAVASAADAITVHTTPGIDVETDGVLGVYVQAGAMFDLGGTAGRDLTREYRDRVIGEHPRQRSHQRGRSDDPSRRARTRAVGSGCCAAAASSRW